MEITEQQFQAYEDVRVSGVTNMFAVNVVSDLTGLTRDELLFIMQHYEELCKKYPNVRSLE